MSSPLKDLPFTGAPGRAGSPKAPCKRPRRDIIAGEALEPLSSDDGNGSEGVSPGTSPAPSNPNPPSWQGSNWKNLFDRSGGTIAPRLSALDLVLRYHLTRLPVPLCWPSLNGKARGRVGKARTGVRFSTVLNEVPRHPRWVMKARHSRLFPRMNHIR